jgi:hypothetical protein
LPPPEDDTGAAVPDIGKGINSMIVEDDNYVGHDFCGPVSRLPDDVNCSPYVDLPALDKYYEDNCEGK